MDITLHPDTDKTRPADDRVTADDPWALGNTNHLRPPVRRASRRGVWLLVGAGVLAVAGSAAIVFALLQLRGEPTPQDRDGEQPARSDKAAPGEKKDDAPLKRTEIRKNLFLEVQ